jgi:peptidase E
MKLFLASSLDKSMQKFNEKIEGGLSGKSVLFIANASDPYDGEKWWVNLDRDTFEKYGSRVENIDLREIDKDVFQDYLEKSDIIHFCGGSVLYLMSLIREKRIEGVLKKYVLNDWVVYSGTSAGSMIPARSLELSKYEKEEKGFVERMADWSGLCFVDFYILPHADSNDFIKSNKEIISHIGKHPPQAIIVVSDNQAVWCEDEKLEIVEV